MNCCETLIVLKYVTIKPTLLNEPVGLSDDFHATARKGGSGHSGAQLVAVKNMIYRQF